MSGRTDTELQEKLNTFYTLGIGDVVRGREYPGKLGEVYYENFESGCNEIGVFYPHTQERIDVTFKDWVEKEYTVVSETEKRWFHRTDTERLEWLVSKGIRVENHGTAKSPIRVLYDLCDDVLAKNSDFRCAIDAAIDAEERG